MGSDRQRVLIAGGGVAALEALLALRALAEERVEIELIAPRTEFVDRPLAVAEPFGLGDARRYDLAAIAADQGATLHVMGVEAVDPAERLVLTRGGARLGYERLVVAVGARPGISLPGSVTVKGPDYTGRFRTVLRELEDRRVKSIVFAVPPGASWPLPLYELALMTAARVAERGLRKVRLSLVTPEQEPLELFGPEASRAIRELLEQRGVELHTARYPAHVEEGGVRVVPAGELVPAQRVVSLPRLRGPRLRGLPHDGEGFIPIDEHCRVEGEADLYAAGDATNFTVKQGGIAAQQADAAAEAIAASAGAPVEPRPLRPVLRGLLLTGGQPRYMRTGSGDTGGHPWEVSEHALWWPPSKVAGRYLAPYLALHASDQAAPAGRRSVGVDADLGGARLRAVIPTGRADPAG